MNITKICPLLEPKINNLVNLRKGLIFTQMIGDYKTYKTLRKEYATYGVKHFELLKRIEFPKISVPVFSREGFNMLKIMIKETFRKKTPDEKLLSKLFKQNILEKKYNIKKFNSSI